MNTRGPYIYDNVRGWGAAAAQLLSLLIVSLTRLTRPEAINTWWWAYRRFEPSSHHHMCIQLLDENLPRRQDLVLACEAHGYGLQIMRGGIKIMRSSPWCVDIFLVFFFFAVRLLVMLIPRGFAMRPLPAISKDVYPNLQRKICRANLILVRGGRLCSARLSSWTLCSGTCSARRQFSLFYLEDEEHILTC